MPNFTDFPRELRDEVYFHAMVPNLDELVPLAQVPTALGPRLLAKHRAGVNTSLFRLNKAVKSEPARIHDERPRCRRAESSKDAVEDDTHPGGFPAIPSRTEDRRVDIRYLRLFWRDVLPQLLNLRELHLAPISLRTREEAMCLLRSNKGNDPRLLDCLFCEHFLRAKGLGSGALAETMRELQRRPDKGFPAVRVHMCSLKPSTVKEIEEKFPMIEWLHVKGCTCCAGYYTTMKKDHDYDGYSDEEKLEADRWLKTAEKVVH
ncbi:uncharacterized protein BDZ99DRAFT_475725 [Mytilinidion resinicola]|uniref:Uncharacterized protein n=1 Tax=Mytilinidion resinicola TaxID=574789 RepID=A0A6A6YQQ8_9PEZI|nr:uncharacterized protein BDZ99DRAFT_475725 [Mytilinidion resinicola]KAF2810849.1 hypothetical protein BDZ99DRAFT_475725 [Mytilinidion resinicola]